jgi:hypothetical protein
MKLTAIGVWGVGVVDTWLWTNSRGAYADAEYSFDMTTHWVDNTEWFYVGITLFDQQTGPFSDGGIFRVNFSLGYEEDYIIGFDQNVQMRGIDVDDWGN